MNAALAAGGGVFAALFVAEVLALLLRPRSVELLSGLLGPVASVAARGHQATRPERIRIALMGMAAGSAMALVIGGPLLAAVVVLACPVATVMVLRARASRWRSAMRDGAAPSARAIGDAARAGLPAVAAVERAASDGAVSPAAAVELRDLATRCRLGLGLDEGLEELRRRAACPAWNALAAAIRVQSEVGGDLAAILHSLASGLEMSSRAREEARSLSSQARLTARIVIALPVAGLAMSEVASPGTLARILAAPLPRALAVLAAVLQVAAVVVVRRVARTGAAS